MKLYDLYATINELRAMAAVLYRKGIAAGHTKESVGEKIQPIRKTLDGVIEEAGKSSVAACITAIKQFENQNLALGEDIKFLGSKIEDNEQYIAKIKKQLEARMVSQSVDFLEDGGFSACLVDARDGTRSVEIR